jgi:HEAT repeat protein
MSKQQEYAKQLAGVPDKVVFLRRHSGLPGPRGNLELVQAAADAGEEGDFRAWIEEGAGDNPTDEFLVVCGVVGLGRLVAEGREELIEELREHAADPRWRVREGVAMALQRVGDCDVSRLLRTALEWADDRPYVQRAAVAGVAEPRLLKKREAAAQAIAIVDRVTANLAAAHERRSDEARTLRQALAYCWSVVVAADPEDGKPLLEHWAASPDPDVRWLVRENLKKARLARLDPEWVAGLLAV